MLDRGGFLLILCVALYKGFHWFASTIAPAHLQFLNTTSEQQVVQTQCLDELKDSHKSLCATSEKQTALLDEIKGNQDRQTDFLRRRDERERERSSA